jgi:hypothetical protein
MHNSVVVTTIGDGYIRPKLTLLWIYALCIGCPAFVGAECSADYWRHADPAALVARTRLACGITMRPSVRLFVGLGSYGFAVFPFPERRKNENKSVFHCPSLTRSIRPLDSTSKHKERREQERRARFAPPAAPVDLILFSAGVLRLLEGHWVDGWVGEGGRRSCHLTERIMCACRVAERRRPDWTWRRRTDGLAASCSGTGGRSRAANPAASSLQRHRLVLGMHMPREMELVVARRCRCPLAEQSASEGKLLQDSQS